jgi:hypothetical protein
MEREAKAVVALSGWDGQTRWRGGTSTAMVVVSRMRVHMGALRRVPGPRRAQGDEEMRAGPLPLRMIGDGDVLCPLDRADQSDPSRCSYFSSPAPPPLSLAAQCPTTPNLWRVSDHLDTPAGGHVVLR